MVGRRDSLLLLLLLGLPACPGELRLADLGPDISTISDPVPAPAPHNDAAMADAKKKVASDSSPTSDLSMAKPDLAGTQPDLMATTPDLQPAPADIGLPDSVPVSDTTPPLSQIGGPCPCVAGTTCVSGVCRGSCTPTGPCGVSAACPADHGCLLTNVSTYVCVPTVAGPGQLCSATAWCPVNYQCTAIGLNPAVCLPTCAIPGVSCGTGGAGQCLAAGGGCNLCSSI